MKQPEQSPPKWANQFLEWYCKPELLEEIQGDIYELFFIRSESIGSKAAHRYFIWDVLRSFRLSTINTTITPLSIHKAMFQNYFKVAWRNMIKQKLYSFINIGGLAIGLTCFILVFLFIKYEYSFDKFYENHSQIHRVIQRWDTNEFIGKELLATTSAALANTLNNDFPEVEVATTLTNTTALLKNESTNFLEKGILADPNFFQVLPQSWISGDVSTALNNPEDIILTHDLAQKIFKEQNPIGQSLELDNGQIKTVSGIIENNPSNSSLQYDFITNISTLPDYKRDQNFAERWFSSSFHTFFLLSEQANAELLQQKLQSYLEEVRKKTNPFPFKVEYLVQPLQEVYLENRTAEDFALKGNYSQLYMFALIGFIVLLISCINYMNLAIARSIGRAKEVKVRKTIGAKKQQLIQQFIGQ